MTPTDSAADGRCQLCQVSWCCSVEATIHEHGQLSLLYVRCKCTDGTMGRNVSAMHWMMMVNMMYERFRAMYCVDVIIIIIIIKIIIIYTFLSSCRHLLYRQHHCLQEETETFFFRKAFQLPSPCSLDYHSFIICTLSDQGWSAPAVSHYRLPT